MSSSALDTHLATLWFCTMEIHRRYKLGASELSRPDIFGSAAPNSTPHVVSNELERPRIFRIYAATTDATFAARQLRNKIRELRAMPGIGSWLDAGDYRRQTESLDLEEIHLKTARCKMCGVALSDLQKQSDYYSCSANCRRDYEAGAYWGGGRPRRPPTARRAEPSQAMARHAISLQRHSFNKIVCSDKTLLTFSPGLVIPRPGGGRSDRAGCGPSTGLSCWEGTIRTLVPSNAEPALSASRCSVGSCTPDESVTSRVAS